MVNVTMSEELAALRIRIPGCSVVAFADLSTGLVLASSTSHKTTQERLDALCAAARASLLGPSAHKIAEDFAGNAQNTPRVAIHADAHGITCFVRPSVPAQEALCCVLSPESPLDRVVEDAQAFLLRIVAED